MEPEKCPRCGNTEFRDIDCGPDSYEDDIFYISYICTKCELWYDGWDNKWYVDVITWSDTDCAEEYEVKK